MSDNENKDFSEIEILFNFIFRRLKKVSRDAAADADDKWRWWNDVGCWIEVIRYGKVMSAANIALNGN